MRNPTRRNRNIGTENQGFKPNNKNTIPIPLNDHRTYWEKLTSYSVVKRSVNGKEYKFLVEKTRKNSIYPCTIDDIVRVLESLPPKDLADLNLIVFRQPKRREETLCPVWGRLQYSVNIDIHEGPAIILEAFDLDRELKWSKALSLEDRNEFDRLVNDGHKIEDRKKYFAIIPTIQGLRNTMLYRTFLHEIGHYVEYLEKVEQPSQHDDDHYDLWLKLWEAYDKIPTSEKEVFAHNYAQKMFEELRKKGVVPFARILDPKSILSDGLNMNDFEIP